MRSATKASLRGDDWTAALTLYADGDLLGNGREQLLLRADYSVPGGSYTSIYLFVLDPEGRYLVVARSYPFIRLE